MRDRFICARSKGMIGTREEGTHAHKLGERDIKRAPFVQRSLSLPSMKKRKKEKERKIVPWMERISFNID